MTDPFADRAEIFKALADKTRLHILALLAKEELCVCELVAVFDMTQPSISQHLRKLRQAGLVKERKTAQWVFYALDGSAFSLIEQIVDTLPDVSGEITRLQGQGLRVQCHV
ncbi:MAG: ArsR/SmtB family transcription factor [Bacilli bacterium]